MNMDYLPELLKGLGTTLELTLASLFTGLVLAILFTLVLALKVRPLTWLVKLQILLFTGTPLLIQIFLIYYGPAQFDAIRNSVLWPWLSQPWFCAMLALALNSAAYSTLLFKGAIDAVPSSDREACMALGMTNRQALLRVILPHAVRRALPAYGNEVILVMKGSSLASTITLMDLMGYAARLNAQTYDTLTVFTMAGLIYLAMTGVLTVLIRFMEHKVLAFSR
ncbi:arginine ABC transporter permease ArtM [Endozoicomonas sp. GU-1]|uniref:arginine ABC transporter permease ArtM n=1 Tax=Endozoicomonas sp. GU-1 TaxID=3009078 RepID=UPI0022B5300F|nr:arginine ABC transporter permease ArtM [Endozoicomonas sp. GU-1]WBA83309.1 arginine ABC transporter permease ArtM [Endozoicomonas sp. GU-1]WBA86240.1 arginine ABC transporter permease ArtM [Endozoicomonas sp. GU-1]